MVFFDLVEKKTWLYISICKTINAELRFVFLKKLHVIAKENLPPKGVPILLVSNHQNGLLDALLILFSIPQSYTVVFLARADIFKKKTLAKILSFLKILPIYRQRDGLRSIEENNRIYAQAGKLMKMDYPICMFPEGTHQDGHFLGEIKKGFARMAFEIAEQNAFSNDMCVLPVANHYQDYFVYHSEACLIYGKPIMLSDYYKLYKTDSKAAILELTARVKQQLETLVLDIDDRQNYEALDFIRPLIREKALDNSKGGKLSLPNALKADKLNIEVLRENKKTRPDEYQEMCSTALSLQRILKQNKIKIETICGLKQYSILKSFSKTLLAITSLPFFIIGFLFYGWLIMLATNYANKIARKIKNRMLQPSILFVLSGFIGVTLINIVYIIIFACIFQSLWLTILFVAFLPLLRIAYLRIYNFLVLYISNMRYCLLSKRKKQMIKELVDKIYGGL